MRLGAEYMDAERRKNILLQISNGKDREARVIGVTSSLPAWVERPFQDDQENFNEELKVYKETAPIIQTLDTRLSQTQGPVWKDLSVAEETALANWYAALDKMQGYVNSYFPSETQQYVARIALLIIAVGALVTPLLISEDTPNLPFTIKPPALPPGITASKRALVEQVRPALTYRPSGRPLEVEAQVFRPSGIPMRRPETAPLGPEQSPARYRTFAKPLGPSIPLAPAAAATASSGAPSPHGPRIFPRYRSQ